MAFETRMTWEKLALELELLAAEDPNSLLPLLVGLNSIIWPADQVEACFRSVNFMCYELMAKCENKNESERARILNDYFFKQKSFHILSLRPGELSAAHLLIKPVLDRKAGSPLAMTILYLHLAAHLDLPIYAVHLKDQSLLKWIRGGQSCFIDLQQQGHMISEDQLLPALSRSIGDGNSGDVALEIVPNRRLFHRYLIELIRIFQNEENWKDLLTCYNVMVKADPNNMKALSNRALLHKRMGFMQEAMSDFKRFFSFVDRDSASPDLQRAFAEVERSLSSIDSEFPSGLLH